MQLLNKSKQFYKQFYAVSLKQHRKYVNVLFVGIRAGRSSPGSSAAPFVSGRGILRGFTLFSRPSAFAEAGRRPFDPVGFDPCFAPLAEQKRRAPEIVSVFFVLQMSISDRVCYNAFRADLRAKTVIPVDQR